MRIAAAIALLISGGLGTDCAYRPVANTRTSVPIEAGAYEATHITAQRVHVVDGYYFTSYLCAGFADQVATAGNVVTAPGCSFVDAYSKQDGTRVDPFVRCPDAADAARHTMSTSSAEPASCAFFYCGPIQVGGYYRKDGTYVRPYTRRK